MENGDIKKIIILCIFLVFTLPFLFKFLFWTTSAVINPSPEKIQQGANLMAEDAIPWWLDIIIWLGGLGTIGAFLIIGFIWFLKWIGEIR